MKDKFENLVKQSKNILIISHVNPDGDTLGSMCAMYGAIQKRFKIKPQMLVPSPIPGIYEFIPYIKEAKLVQEFDKSREFDLVITVDVAALDRALDAQILFGKAKHTVNFDHHKTNSLYGELNFVDPAACSTGEVVFKFFEELNWEIDLPVAQALYTAIMTDTGGFRFENTNPSSFEIASKLLKIGVNPKEMYNNCYESKTKDVVMFQNYVVSNAKFSDDEAIAYATISRKDMEKFNVKDSATDGIAETLRSIVSTQVAFVLREIDSKTFKVSMRSKFIDVSKVCEAFGGGGHKYAAGCTIHHSLAESVKRLLNEISLQKS